MEHTEEKARDIIQYKRGRACENIAHDLHNIVADIQTRTADKCNGASDLTAQELIYLVDYIEQQARRMRDEVNKIKIADDQELLLDYLKEGRE